jgi:CHAT domain-containing protein
MLAVTARADDAEELRAAQTQTDKLYEAGRYREAEAYAKRMVAIGDRAFRNQPKVISTCYEKLGRASATVLYNLVQRDRNQPGEPAAQPVLTVANPAYTTPASVPVSEGLAELAARGRFRSAGGTLSALPYTQSESAWVAEGFKKHGITVAALREGLATEANVRGNVGGRRVLHLACHGLADQAYGNFFGCLAHTPGTNATSNSADDGFLTLPEIYGLNLKQCDLAILGACQTNYGPQQRGEGIWGLSRGFLVACARRVVASNWLVDDEAAASLISVFCSDVAKVEGKGETPDYAAALHRAKRWVRGQAKWASPYYWGTFVLVGPN